MKYVARPVVSISDLIEKLKADLASCTGPFWYRGQADKAWKLLPRLSRLNRNINEIDLLRRFRQNATLLINPRPQKTEEWLFIMQHHGAPTRLLDWSESPLMATFFGVNTEPEKDGALWVLMPLELNKQGGNQEIPAFEEENTLSAYLPEFIDKRTTVTYLPTAISATRNTPRMQSQLSVFTISHKAKMPIESIGDKHHIWRYIIPRDKKPTILKELSLLGISRFQLFPELQTLGELIGESC